MLFFLVKVIRYKTYISHDSILLHFGKGKTVGVENKSVMPRGWGGRELTAKGSERALGGDRPVLQHDCLCLFKFRTVQK